MINNQDFNLITEPRHFSANDFLGSYIYSHLNYRISFLLLRETKNFLGLGYWEYSLIIDAPNTSIRAINLLVKKKTQIDINKGMHWELFRPILKEIKNFLLFNKFNEIQQERGNFYISSLD